MIDRALASAWLSPWETRVDCVDCCDGREDCICGDGELFAVGDDEFVEGRAIEISFGGRVWTFSKEAEGRAGLVVAADDGESSISVCFNL